MGAAAPGIEKLRRELRRLGAPVGDVDVAVLQPMLAEHADQPFSGPGWVFELKHDGFRLLARRHHGAPLLRYRSGTPTAAFPEIESAVAALPVDAVVDGELVVLDAGG